MAGNGRETALEVLTACRKLEAWSDGSLKAACRRGELDREPGDDGIESGFADRDVEHRLDRLLHHLPEPYKEVFSLRTFGELPFAQIGELFGKTESWARVTYFRARQKLKEGFDGPSGP